MRNLKLCIKNGERETRTHAPLWMKSSHYGDLLTLPQVSLSSQNVNLSSTLVYDQQDYLTLLL